MVPFWQNAWLYMFIVQAVSQTSTFTSTNAHLTPGTWLYGNYHTHIILTPVWTFTPHLTPTLCNSACWARTLSFDPPPHGCPPIHPSILSCFSAVQVWTGPAPFLVRPITAKEWPPLDPEQSLVSVTSTSPSFLLQRCCSYIFIYICLSSVLPSRPQNLTAVETTATSLRLAWQPAFGGDYPIIRCTVQVRWKRGEEEPPH